MNLRHLIIVTALPFCINIQAAESTLPETGISGVYEVMLGTDNAEQQIEYFGEFGFSLVGMAELNETRAMAIYGVPQKLKSWRLQNGNIDSHGLLRILEWERLEGPGVGYAPPETIGQRMAVMRTEDIFRIDDVFNDLRRVAEEPWLSTTPVYDDLYGMSETTFSITRRRIGVRENAVYGDFFNHVFFQRYGYTIPGYGTIGEHSPLRTSEFTHNDFIIKGDIAEVTEHYSTVLGLRSENEPVIDGDWQKGPQAVFMMAPGDSHWYRGFVSPNNICGKLKFFVARDPLQARDRTDQQKPGRPGITLHSLYTPKLEYVHELAQANRLTPNPVMDNEFGEKSFLFTGPDGVSWQIIEQPEITNIPVTQFELQTTNH